MIIVILAALLALWPVFWMFGTPKVAVAAFALVEWQRYKGFKKGEGIGTPKEGNIVSGFVVCEDSESDIGRYVFKISQMFDELKPFVGKRFWMTESEAEPIRTVVEGCLRTSVVGIKVGQSSIDNATKKAALAAAVKTAEAVRDILLAFPKERISNT